MKSLKVAAVAAFLLLVGGCGSAPGVGGSDQVIPLTQIDQNLQSRLPISRKASFGTVKILGMALQPSTDNRTMEVSVKFILTSYEIPEGIEGLITYQAQLRYAPESRRLYLSELKPLRLSFGNPSLEEYVSTAARKGIATLVASTLRTLPIQTMPEGFRAKGIEKAAIVKDQLMVDFN